jgi:hypothetical protein
MKRRDNNRGRAPRPVRPAQEVESPGYPSAKEAGVTRRGLLQLVLGGGAAAAGSVLLPDMSEARRMRGVKRRPRYRVAVKLVPPYRFKGCRSAIVEIVGKTYSRDASKFYADPAELAGIQQVVRKVLGRFKCADLKGRRRVAVLGALRSALTDHYRKRRKKRYGGIHHVRLKEK